MRLCKRSIDSLETAKPAVQGAEHHAGQSGAQNSQPGRPAMQRDGIACHRAHDQCAFQAQVDTTALFGQAFT